MYLPYKNSRNSLLPRDLGELIPPNAPVRILNSLIEKLALSGFDTLYSEEGRPSYAPEMMLKLLIFAYMSSVYSCRDIERFAQRDLHAYWLVGGQVPEFSTINRFRKKSSLCVCTTSTIRLPTPLNAETTNCISSVSMFKPLAVSIISICF